MWARVVEFMFGCWLAVSPFVFHHGDQTWLWVLDFLFASTVIVLAVVSYYPPLGHAHLATMLVALAMIGIGRFSSAGLPPPAMQNYIVVGLLLLMFAIVPNHATQPPRSRREQTE